jgi:hypothetical protein
LLKRPLIMWHAHTPHLVLLRSKTL